LANLTVVQEHSEYWTFHKI